MVQYKDARRMCAPCDGTAVWEVDEARVFLGEVRQFFADTGFASMKEVSDGAAVSHRCHCKAMSVFSV